MTADDLTRAVDRFDREAIHAAFETPRYRMRYVDWRPMGSPEATLVLVHGMCDRARSFAMVMARLVDSGIRCVGYELAAGADDGANLGMYKHSHYVGDLIAFLDHMRLDQVDLLGSSFGSTIALRALATHPDRFRRAVLQGGFARRPLMRIERGLSRIGRYWHCLMRDVIFRNRAMAIYDGPAFVGCPPEYFRFLLECSGATPARAAARRTLIIDKIDLRPLLPVIPHKVLMIGGDRDALVPRWCEAEVESGVKDVRRIEFSPCGHYPQYTMWERMAGEIREFLS